MRTLLATLTAAAGLALFAAGSATAASIPMVAKSAVAPLASGSSLVEKATYGHRRHYRHNGYNSYPRYRSYGYGYGPRYNRYNSYGSYYGGGFGVPFLSLDFGGRRHHGGWGGGHRRNW